MAALSLDQLEVPLPIGVGRTSEAVRLLFAPAGVDLVRKLRQLEAHPVGEGACVCEKRSGNGGTLSLSLFNLQSSLFKMNDLLTDLFVGETRAPQSSGENDIEMGIPRSLFDRGMDSFNKQIQEVDKQVDKLSGLLKKLKTKLKSAIPCKICWMPPECLCLILDRESDSEAEDIEHAEKLCQVKAVLEEEILEGVTRADDTEEVIKHQIEA